MEALRRKEPAFDLSNLRGVVLKWLDLEDANIVDVIVATYVANKFSTDPTWLLVIAPPSCAKTELLRGFQGHVWNGEETTYFISNLTPSTIVSGVIPKKGRPEPSLIYRLTDKMVVFKDFTSILSMRSENQQEIIATLRECYDGQYTKEFGNGKSINWRGRFGLIGACTPIYDQHYGVIAQMGERFLLYRVQGLDDLAIGRRAQEIVGREEEMREEIKTAIHRFLDRFQDLSTVTFKKTSASISERMVNLACIISRGRCPVSRDYRNGEVLCEPSPEGSPRITKQLHQMAMGLALVREKPAIDEGVLLTIQKMSRDLMPAYRRIALEYLWEREAFAGSYTAPTTTEVAEGTGMITKTALRTLEDLMLVGVANRKRTTSDAINAPYHWGLTERAEQLIKVGGLFEK